MAVVFEGFSIREYASKMRSIDVVKCWPFSGDSSSGDDDDDGNSKMSKQSMESLLPPITVTKFRWWSDELDLLKSIELQSSSSRGMEKNNLQEKEVNLHVGEKSYERSDMLECPVCGAFSASTVNALNAHVDSCLAQASRQARRQMRMLIRPTKSRTPKKRSITEIFAVAPQIQKVDALEEDENGGLEELNCKTERPKKKKVAIVKKLMNKRTKLKKKNNKQNGLMIVNKPLILSNVGT
ncbi:hypothetical protein F3Y22_tig00110783pilonHSYRG00246 [Hibiscus syriacus]|uniref:UBZ4-type domain-containing protein n=1 Tax=Hibiscus syriacus TaxID=106335 RepID=A0A6A2ZTE5_HIBSY|nr:hypothetical protein F3Y22_tig00110783pilonHSYRG00246 [Hibiscus syriacus]